MAQRDDEAEVMTMEFDNTDRRIISMLQLDGRRSYTSIAHELSISEGAVRYRVQHLVNSGIMQIVAVTDPLRVGYDLLTMVDITVRAGMVGQVTEALCDVDGVNWVSVIAGAQAQIRIEILSKNTEHYRQILHEHVEMIDGVLSSSSTMILKILKTNYGWGVPEIQDPSDTSAEP